MKTNKRILSIIIVMMVTFLTRGLGFAREMLVAYKFGASSFSDAFITSLTIPDILVNGFGVSICTMYIPLFIKCEKEDYDIAKKFNSTISVLLLGLALFFIFIFEFFPSFMLKLFASGFSDESLGYAISLSRIMIFSSVPILLAQQYKAFFQVKDKYSIAIILSAVINIFIILGIVVSTPETSYILAILSLFGNLLYFLIMLIISFKLGFRYSKNISFKNMYIKRMFVGIGPIILANLVNELNQVIDRNFASNLGVGSVSYINYSSKIVYLILAMIGLAISGFYYPKLVSDDCEERNTLIINLNSMISLIVVPITIFVFIFAKSIVSVLFEHGNFGNVEVEYTSSCLRFYCLAIFSYNINAIWVSIFNSELDTIKPGIISLFVLVLNIILNFVLMKYLQNDGLALATSISILIADILLITLYKQKHKNFNLKRMLFEFLKIVIASFIFLLLLIPYYYLNFGVFINFVLYIISFFLIFIIYIFILICFKSELIINVINKRGEKNG